MATPKSLINRMLDQGVLSMAYSRSKAEDLITQRSEQVFTHIVKVLKWNDPLNSQKHINDINGFMVGVVDIRLTKGAKIKRKDYINWMFRSRKQMDRLVKFTLVKYHDLPELRSNDEVWAELLRIYEELSKDLAADNFDGVNKYL